MIDGSTMIIAGIAALRPHLRGPGMLATVAFLPISHEPALPGRPAAIVAPAPLDR